MPVSNCPNRTHPDYKTLIDYYGEPVAMAIYKRNGEQIPDLSTYNNMSDVTREFFPEAASVDEATMESFQRQKAILSDSLNADVILDASIKGSGQLETGAERPTIRINPSYFGGDTLIHEYGHLYIDLLGGMNNSMIQQGRKYLNGTDLEQRVKDMYPELTGDKLDKEILATAIGIEGEKIFNASQQSLVEKFKNWLNLFFNRIKGALGLEQNVAKELARQLLNNQINDQLMTELETDVQMQKTDKGSPLMSKSEVLRERANVFKRIKSGIETKLARYNQILNTSTVSEKQENAIGKLKELVKEFAKNDDAEAITSYISIGLSETNAMLERLRGFQSGDLKVTSKRLNDIHNYLQSYSYAEEIKNLLDVDADLDGKLREGTLKDSEKDNLLDALDQIISNHSKITSMYRQQSKFLLAGKFAKRNGRIHAKYREEYGKEFDRNQNRTRPFIGRSKHFVNGEEVSQKEYKNARKEYVNKQIADNKPQIVREEKQHWVELFDLGPTDLGSFEVNMMDPASINDDIIQIAHELIERADFRAMQNSVEKFKVADELFTRFNKVKTDSNQKKKYDELIENEVDENGKATGKKSGYMVSKYHSKVFEIKKDYFLQIQAAREEGNKAEVDRLNDELIAWLKKNTIKIAGQYIPSDKWLNPQWEKLNELRKEKSPIAEMYDHIIKLREETDSNYPNITKLNKKGLGSTFYKLPSVNASNMERVMENGFIGTMKQNLKDILKIRASDTDYRPEQVEDVDSDENAIGKESKRITKAMGDESGGLTQNIPVYFRRGVDASDQSYDLLSVHLLDNSMSTNYKEKSKIHADVAILKDLSATRDVQKTKSGALAGLSKMVNVFTGKDEAPIIEKGENTKAHKALVSLVESRMYGIKKLGDEKINKITDNLLSWTGDVMLIGNWLSASANLMQGKTMNWIESLGATDFTHSDLVTGEGKYWADAPAWSKDFGRRRFYSKTNLLIEEFNALGDWSAVARKFVDDTRLKQQFKKSTLHGLNSMAEHYIQSTAMYALLNNIKVKDASGAFLGRNEDGKIVKVESIDDAMSLDEAYDVVDGRLVLNDRVASTTNTMDGMAGEEISKEDIEDISFLMRDINADLQGQYDSRQQAVASRYWYGRSFLVLRRWLPRGWMRRFRGSSTIGLDPEDIRLDERFYSRSRGDFKSGLYSDTMRLLFSKEYINTMKDEGVKASYELLKQNWNDMSEVEYANVRRGLAEFAMMSLTLSAGALLKGLADDEDDEYQKQGLFYLAFLSARLNSELLFYVNPQETFRILKSPAASISILLNTLHLGEQIIKDFPFTDMEQYERGKLKGKYKMEKDVEDLMPIFNQLNRNVEEALGWLYSEQML